MAALLLITILVVLIVVHELGHFVAAKLLRVRVEEFGVGYPPRAITFGTWGGTEYTLNWLPFGGCVRLLEEDGPEDGVQRRRAGSFSSASRSRQSLILLAGVIANALFGWALFSAGFMIGMPAIVEDGTPGAQLIVSTVVPSSPAFESGLRSGDSITSIIEEGKTGIAELTPSAVSEFVSMRGGRDLLLTYERSGVSNTITIIPAHAIIPDKPSQAALGVGLALISERKLPMMEALGEAARQSVAALQTVLYGLGSLAYHALLGDANIRTLMGPVGLSGAVGDAASHGLGQLFGLAALISFNLVVINLLPIPALDGGRLVFVAIEAVRRKRMSYTVARLCNIAGFALIILLMLIVTYNDIGRLLR